MFTLEEERPEWEFLKGCRLRGTYDNPTGDATHPAQFQLRNPAGSGVIAIIKNIRVTTTTGAVVTVREGFVAAQADLGTVISSANHDTRWGITTAGVLIASDSITAAAVAYAVLTDIYTVSGAIISPVYSQKPLILAPSTRLLWQTAANAQQLIIEVDWLERPLGKYEAA